MTAGIGRITSFMGSSEEFSEVLRFLENNPFKTNSFKQNFENVALPLDRFLSRLQIREKKAAARICDIYGVETPNKYYLPFTLLEEERLLKLISNIKNKYLIQKHVESLRKSNPRIDSRKISELIKSIINQHLYAGKIITTTPTGDIILYNNEDNEQYVFKPTTKIKEIEAHTNFNHPNIIFCLAVMENIGVYIEKAESSMEKDLEKSLPDEKLNKIKKYIFEIANALNEMHMHGYVHLDVKEQNILICKGKAKLSDFGLTEKIGYKGDAQGTPFYISPEIIKQEGATQKSDVWSLGIVLFHSLTGKYTGDPNIDHIAFMRCTAIMQPDLSPLDALPNNEYYNRAKDLLRLMLKKNPAERITMEEVLNHPFFKD